MEERSIYARRILGCRVSIRALDGATRVSIEHPLERRRRSICGESGRNQAWVGGEVFYLRRRPGTWTERLRRVSEGMGHRLESVFRYQRIAEKCRRHTCTAGV